MNSTEAWGTDMYYLAGAKFADENFIMKHDKAGILSMVGSTSCGTGILKNCEHYVLGDSEQQVLSACVCTQANSGKDTNGSQFFITLVR